MVASSLADDASANPAITTAKIEAERPGSDRYKQDHMSLIFQRGLSFSGFERNKVFFGGSDGGYVDLSDVSGADTDADARAVLVADFDDDGDADLFVNAIQREQHLLYRNNLDGVAPNRFAKFRLRAARGHPDAIGAIVRVHRGSVVQAQVLTCGSGFESQNALELIFGLGGVNKARVTVRWPGREEEDFGEIEAGGRYVLTEGAGKPSPFAAKTFRFVDPAPRGVKVRLGDRLGSLALKTVTGEDKTLDLTQEKRKTLLNFWATTCASCVAELPELAKLHTGETYRVIAVNLDPPSQRDAILELWSKLSLPFDTFLIGDKDADRLFDVARMGIPLSIVVGADGRIERILQGRIREGQL